MSIAPLGRLAVEQRLKMFYVSLILVNIAGALGLLFALQSGRPNFFGLTVVLMTGTLVADALVLYSLGGHPGTANRLNYGESTRTRRILSDVRAPASVLLIGVFVLTVIGQGGLWYLSMGGFFFVMMMRVYFTDYSVEPAGVDLALLMIGAGLLIASQTLTVAYHAMTRDTVYHSAVATRIANYGLESIAGTRYSDLQVYHVLVATGLGMADISARLFAAVLFAVVFPVVVPMALEIAREFRFTATMGLLAGVTLAVNPAFVRWGSQAHPQSLSFVFFLFFILLLAGQTNHRRTLVLSLLLSCVWIMTHHLSLFMSIVLAAIPLGVIAVQRLVRVFRRDSERSDWPQLGPAGLKYVLLVASALLYWEHIGLFREAEGWLFEYSPAASAGLETTASLIITYEQPATILQQSIPGMLSNFHYGLWIGFAALGIWTLVKSPRINTRNIPMLLLALLAAGVLYFPNPVWIPLRGVAFLERWGIMTLPFIAGAVVLAMDQLRQTVANGRRIVVPVVMLVLLVTVSVSSGFSDPSIADMAGYERGERKYLSSADMAAYSHTTTYSNPADEITSGGILNNYFILQDWIRRPGEPRPVGPWDDRYNRIEVADGEINAEDGLTVFQKTAFEEKGIRMAIANPDYEAYEGLGDITILAAVSNEDYAWDGDSESIVYSNGENVIAYQDDNE